MPSSLPSVASLVCLPWMVQEASSKQQLPLPHSPGSEQDEEAAAVPNKVTRSWLGHAGGLREGPQQGFMPENPPSVCQEPRDS